MTVYKGSSKIGNLYIGSTKIGKVYKGSTLVYQGIVKIIKNSVSNSTTFYLMGNGELYGAGNNGYGQQGDGSTTRVTSFTKKL